ncbi:Mucin-13 [Trapelia coarctata]|nr:Mucin-13 [Trapelia coarctata]
MQYSKIAFLAALAAPLVSAQSLNGLPTCAETAAISALGSTGCGLTDFACICKNSAFLTSLQPQVAAACSPSDLAAALTFAQQLCASVGVTLTISGSSPSAPSTTPAPETTTTTAVVAATTVTSAVVTTLSTTVPATVITTQAPVSEFTDGQPQVPTNATTIAAPTVTPFKGAATANNAQGAIAALLAAVGVFVAL